jgi:hypothetical protein
MDDLVTTEAMDALARLTPGLLTAPRDSTLGLAYGFGIIQALAECVPIPEFNSGTIFEDAENLVS